MLLAKKSRALKMPTNIQQDVKTAPENSYLTCQSKGLVTLNRNIKKEVT